MENNVAIIIAFILPRIALSSKGLSVSIMRGKGTMSVREEKGKMNSNLTYQCLAVPPYVNLKEKRVKCGRLNV